MSESAGTRVECRYALEVFAVALWSSKDAQNSKRLKKENIPPPGLHLRSGQLREGQNGVM